jgi:hypothetical protein
VAARALGAGEPRGAALVVRKQLDAAQDSRILGRSQACPVERHDPLPDEKLTLFGVPQAHRLVGTWQGPGTIAQLRRARP